MKNEQDNYTKEYEEYIDWASKLDSTQKESILMHYFCLKKKHYWFMKHVEHKRFMEDEHFKLCPYCNKQEASADLRPKTKEGEK